MTRDREPVWVERRHSFGEAVGTALVAVGTFAVYGALVFGLALLGD